MTNEKQKTFSELTSEVEKYFKSLSYSNARIQTYRKGWKLLYEFMQNHSIEFYEPMVGDAFIRNIIGSDSYEQLSRREKDTIRCANVLTEYKTTGVIKYRSVLKSYEFEGEIGKIILGYLTYKKLLGQSEDTVNNNRLYLHRLLKYLNNSKVFLL